MAERLEVWTVALDALTVPDARLVRRVTDAELRRAERFRRPRDRRRWLPSRFALRELLGRRLHRDPRDIGFRLGMHGKPELARRADRLQFNLAHSRGICLVALSPHDPVGIDIEFARRFDDMPLVAERVFTREERAAFGPAGSSRYAGDFYTAWTRKEALIKATGDGLSAPLQSFEVFPGEGCRTRAIDYRDTRLPGWQLVDLPVAQGYYGALAVPAPGVADIALRAFNACADPGDTLPHARLVAGC